eukprot:3833935-Rhodomonas_salina.1
MSGGLQRRVGSGSEVAGRGTLHARDIRSKLVRGARGVVLRVPAHCASPAHARDVSARESGGNGGVNVRRKGLD